MKIIFIILLIVIIFFKRFSPKKLFEVEIYELDENRNIKSNFNKLIFLKERFFYPRDVIYYYEFLSPEVVKTGCGFAIEKGNIISNEKGGFFDFISFGLYLSKEYPYFYTESFYDELSINLKLFINKKNFYNFLLKNKNYEQIQVVPLKIEDYSKEITEFTPILRSIKEHEIYKEYLIIEFFHVFNKKENVKVYKYINKQKIESNFEELSNYLQEVYYRNLNR